MAAVARRLGREPTILDLGSGLELTRLRPYRPVGAPSTWTGGLPYLDETFDVVLLPARLARSRAGAAEARRVARRAVIRVSGSGRAAAALHWRRPSAPEGLRVIEGRRGAGRSPARRGRRALLCVPDVPAFDRAAAPGRMMDLATALAAEGFEVTVAVRAGAGEASARAFQERGLKLLSGFGPATDRAVAARGFELVLFADWVTAEAYASTVRRLAPATRVVVDAPDLGLVLRARDLVEDASRYGRGLSLEEGADFARELNVHAAADAVWTASPREAEHLSALLGRQRQADVVPDIAGKPAGALPLEARRGVLFAADFRRPSDVAAVRRLCERILPRLDARLRARHPLFIAGDAPPMEVQRWAASVPQARVTGRVPSLEPYLQRCRVVMAPPSFGASARRMMIHALAAGTPLVGTSASHEELGLQPGRHLLVEQDDARVAAALARVLSDDALWKKLAAAGQAEILARQGEEKARAALRAALDRLRGRPLRRGPRELPVAGSSFQGPPMEEDRPDGDEADGDAPRVLSADMAALLRTGAARHGARHDVVVLSIIDWNERFQRPQQLALQMAAHGHRVFYVERPRARGRGTPAPDRSCAPRPRTWCWCGSPAGPSTSIAKAWRPAPPDRSRTS